MKCHITGFNLPLTCFQKFREYVLNSNRIARLTAKYENIRSTLGDKSSHSNLDGQPGNGAGVLTLTRRPNTARRRRIGNAAGGGRQTKLFGGSLEEYLEETNQVERGFLHSAIDKYK